MINQLVPSEVLFIVFQYLPGNDLLKAERTCKWWSETINDSLWKLACYRTFDHKSFHPNWYKNDFKVAYKDLYKKRLLNRTNVPLIIAEGQKDIRAIRLERSNNGNIQVKDDKVIYCKEQLRKSDSVSSFTQSTADPFGTFVAISRYFTTSDILIVGTNGVKYLRIKARFGSFYNYWSPDGQKLSWLSNYHGGIGFWVIDVMSCLYEHYKSQGSPGQSLWDYYKSSENCLEIECGEQLDLNSPYFYAWRPYSSLPTTALTTSDYQAFEKILQEHLVNKIDTLLVQRGSSEIAMHDVDKSGGEYFINNFVNKKIIVKGGIRALSPMWLSPTRALFSYTTNTNTKIIMDCSKEGGNVVELYSANDAGFANISCSRCGTYVAFFAKKFVVINVNTMNKYELAQRFCYFMFHTNQETNISTLYFLDDVLEMNWRVWREPVVRETGATYELVPIAKEVIKKQYIPDYIFTFFTQYNLSQSFIHDDLITIINQNEFYVKDLVRKKMVKIPHPCKTANFCLGKI
ncbi:FBXO48 [Acrasis kona]|uniref:FBXO48 n=1 Tax=Acrasis kona TaxID=1008807 RepID=A0AAW2ZPC2_9EUKA